MLSFECRNLEEAEVTGDINLAEMFWRRRNETKTNNIHRRRIIIYLFFLGMLCNGRRRGAPRSFRAFVFEMIEKKEEDWY